ncbi:MAG: MoaD/ThiS family protein [Pirellulaceae bacterium]
MKIRVKLFAAAQETIGRDEITVELEEPANIAQLRLRLSQEYPKLAPLVSKSMFAIDNQYAQEDSPLSENAEVACIPPVSGG